MPVLWLLFAVLLGASGHLLIKSALGSSITLGKLLDFKMILGTACYFLSFLAWLPWLVSRSAGVAVPAASLTYIAVFLYCVMQGQTYSIMQVAGIVAIVAGVLMLNS